MMMVSIDLSTVFSNAGFRSNQPITMSVAIISLRATARAWIFCSSSTFIVDAVLHNLSEYTPASCQLMKPPIVVAKQGPFHRYYLKIVCGN